MAKRKQTNYIAIHCAWTTKAMDHVDAAEIDRWHRQRGWSRIGYSYVITRDGTVEVGRGHDEIGAHVKGYNHESVGVCLVGGLNDEKTAGEDNFTDAQWKALANLVTTLKDFYPDAEVLGHRDFPNVKKECPCFDAREWWNKVQNS